MLYGYWVFLIRQNSSDSVPTSNLVCIKMASILDSQSRDFKHGVTSYLPLDGILQIPSLGMVDTELDYFPMQQPLL